MSYKLCAKQLILTVWALTSCLLFAQRALAEDTIRGQVLGGGKPLANTTVTLWEASAGAPKQLGQSKTDGEGRFEMHGAASGTDTSLYLIATGGEPNSGGGNNPAIALLSVLGNKAPSSVTINEMTTVASVWTNNQFLNGSTLQGHALGLKIAAGNVPSFVDLATGGWGTTIQDPLNSSQTPTMANFATLADALAGCVTRVNANACNLLFAAATGPKGNTPADTLTAAESIAQYPWYKPERIFYLVNGFYSRTRRQDNAPGSVYALSRYPSERMGDPVEILGWRLRRRRQGDVRQPGQSLGRRQLHHRLASSGRTVARTCHQVRA